MGKIAVLSDEIINLLRAGETVQHPVNVVKELLDNAIDSGATEIKIKIEGGGKKVIEVSDNGCGMASEDASLCLLPHATSKIKTIDDLNSISSLGFRGEALHSIATVSMIELRTKEHSADVGVLISNFGGKISSKMVGCSSGTYISVKALFYNTPARKTSMKSDAAETLSVTKLVGRYMLVRPEINFTYYVNGKVHMVQRKDASEESAVTSILGQDVMREMTKVDYETEGVYVKGFVGSAQLTKRTSEGIVISVNGRYIEDISPFIKAIRDGYRRSIQGHEFPCVILRITIDPAKIDPNIHPQKSAIEIRDPELFRRVLFESIASCQRVMRSDYTEGYFQSLPKDSSIVVDPKHGEINNFFSDVSESSEDSIGKIDSYPNIEVSEKKKDEDPSYRLPELQVIGQFKKTYIIASSPESFLFIVDQHALHEKQLYEELVTKTHIEISKPPFPYILNLTPEDSDILESSLDLFKENGLEMDRLDHNTWKCYTVPSMNNIPIPENEIINLVKDTVGNLNDKPTLEDFKQKMLAEVACKSAIRANEVLGVAEMVRLLDKGKEMKDAYFCPHGRPAIKVYRDKTVDRWFKR